MPLIFTTPVAAALIIGLMIGFNIGFAIGAWWHALRTETRAASRKPNARAYRGPWPIRDSRALADVDKGAEG